MSEKCPVCGGKPNKWVDDGLSLFWGHCGVTCEGRERWNKYAAAMEYAKKTAYWFSIPDCKGYHEEDARAEESMDAAQKRVLEVFGGQ